MSDDTLNPNFEWKKKSFGKKERLSRRIDAHQATLFNIRKKNNFTSAAATTADSLFGPHLKNMRKKIKDVYDEDEEEEEKSIGFDPLTLLDHSFELENNPLFQGLNDCEKKVATQKKILKEMKMQQDAAKTSALTALNKLAQQTGTEKLSTQEISAHIQNNAWGKDTFKTALEQNIGPDIKADMRHLDTVKIKKLMKGLKRLKKIGGYSAVQGMKINDIIHITDNRFDDTKVAKMLLQKTGRKLSPTQDKKIKKAKQPSKVSFKKLLQRKQAQNLTKV